MVKVKIAIIDADLLRRKNHRFPNLVCEKISSYYKSKGSEVVLKMDYDNLDDFDDVYISKVFTDTPVPDWVLVEDLPENIHIGGTGFYFDKAPDLPYEIEHIMPDYSLYDQWVTEQMANGVSSTSLKEYTDYSMGFITRGCFRKCGFCVNHKYDKVFLHSNLEEFYDPNRKKICLLDDNILGYPHWKDVFNVLMDTKKPFKFKQGLDERLLTEEKCELLFNAKYDGDRTFAFDNIADYDLIESKLKLIRKYTQSNHILFYVIVGFESTSIEDIVNMWKRIELLMRYRCVPYIMRYQSPTEVPWKLSKFKPVYAAVTRWCNQPAMFKKKSFREFCELTQTYIKSDKTCADMRGLKLIEDEYPDIAKRYFDLKFESEVKA